MTPPPPPPPYPVLLPRIFSSTHSLQAQFLCAFHALRQMHSHGLCALIYPLALKYTNTFTSTHTHQTSFGRLFRMKRQMTMKSGLSSASHSAAMTSPSFDLLDTVYAIVRCFSCLRLPMSLVSCRLVSPLLLLSSSSPSFFLFRWALIKRCLLERINFKDE